MLTIRLFITNNIIVQNWQEILPWHEQGLMYLAPILLPASKAKWKLLGEMVN